MATGALRGSARTGAPTRGARHRRRRAPRWPDLAYDAERREDVPSLWALQIFWLPVTGLLLIAAVFAVSRPAFYWLTEEDQPLEWLQFALCLFTGLVAAAAALGLARRRRFLAALIMLALALGMLGLAGEEISWAQRIIGEETPAALAAVNKQGETNLHNIEPGFPVDDVFKVAEFLICVGGALLSPLVRRRPPVLRAPLLRLLAPPLFTVPLFVTMAVYQAVQYLVVPESWDAVARLQEWAEVCMYLGLAILALSAFRVAHRRPVPAPRGGHGRERESRFPAVAGVLVLLVTVACAVLSALSGIQPGNV